ncbi:helix-turn-helix domain-containing protein, partial [Streptosporangium canum]|uniref:helix-turn-helix domain-containing protein n=1 Tax=Streptosporangium canum TaxID=324952 RepID=UPI0034461356
MAQRVKRAFTYRFYPTPEQAEQLARTFGCARLVYNKALEERSRAYAMEGRRVSYGESSAALTQWKRTDRARLARAQRALARKQRGSSNRVKARVRVAR